MSELQYGEWYTLPSGKKARVNKVVDGSVEYRVFEMKLFYKDTFPTPEYKHTTIDSVEWFVEHCEPWDGPNHVND